MNEKFNKIQSRLMEYEKYGKRILLNQTLLICHVPHVAPEAWLNTIYHPLEEDKIELIEKKLDITLPDDLRDFYTFANGINIYSGSMNVYGYHTPLYYREGDDAIQPYDVIEINKDERKWMPEKYFIFGSYRWDGSKMIYNLGSKNAKVYRYHHKEGQLLNEWESLWEWLSSETERLSAIYDEKGVKFEPKIPTIPKNDIK